MDEPDAAVEAEATAGDAGKAEGPAETVDAAGEIELDAEAGAGADVDTTGE